MRTTRALPLGVHLLGAVTLGLLVGMGLAAAIVLTSPVISILDVVAAGLMVLASPLALVLLLERRMVRFMRELVAGADAVAEGQCPPVPSFVVSELDEVGRAIETAGVSRRHAEEEMRHGAEREQAELVRREQTARAAAEAAAARAALLGEAGRLLAVPLDDATLVKLARLAAGTIADWCVIDLVEGDGRLRRVAVAHVDPARSDLAQALQVRYPPGPDGPATLTAVLASGRAELVATVTAEDLQARARTPEHLRILRGLGVRSMMVVPLTAWGRVVGAITLVRAVDAGYTGDDLRSAEELAHRTAMAVDNAQIHAGVGEARERFARLIEGLDAVAWEANPLTLAFTFVSQRAETLLGLSRRALARRPGVPGRHHPSGGPRGRARAVRALRAARGGRPVPVAGPRGRRAHRVARQRRARRARAGRDGARAPRIHDRRHRPQADGGGA